MSKQKYHHLVPDCYIKNFATRKKGKNSFVDVIFCNNKNDILTAEILCNQNTKNICGENNFYVIDASTLKERLLLENWYGTLETNYTPIYKKLVKQEVQSLTLEEKRSLLMFIIAQRLRVKTNHIALNSITERIIDFAFKHNEYYGLKNEITSEHGELWNFEGKSQQEAIKDSENSNRQVVNIQSANMVDNLAEMKMDFRMVVFKKNGKSGFISNDNPVRIANNLVYDPDNTISISIDREHILMLYPKNRLPDIDPLVIVRSPMLEEAVKIYNVTQIERRIGCIYGQEKDILDTIREYRRINTAKKKL